MLKIRLTRTGQKNQPHYRIIVTERRSKRDGKYLDNLGHYTPTTKPSTFVLDTTKYDTWVSRGAQPSPVVRGLYQKATSNQKQTTH